MTTENTNTFFSNPETRWKLELFLDYFKSSDSFDSFEEKRYKIIREIIGSILSDTDQWDATCAITTKGIGNPFLDNLEKIQHQNDKDSIDKLIDLIFAGCYQFAYERYLSNENFLFEGGFYEYSNFVFENFTKFTQDAQCHIKVIYPKLYFQVIKSLTEKNNSFDENINKTIEDWKKDLSDYIAEVHKLKSDLKTIATGHNFVGLHEGFNKLSEVKNIEKKSLRCALIFLGLLIPGLLIAELWCLILHFENFNKIFNKIEDKLILATATMSIVAILFYYFRIFLHNYKSVKSQILQIELRKTLCQFIQNYANYSSELKKNNNDALQKFENIIFSGIVSDDEKLPSTYDGLEQLSNFIKSVQKP